MSETYDIPVGLGAGKVWAFKGGTTLNLFVAPQYTVAHDGVVPHWQVFARLSMQFPLGH